MKIIFYILCILFFNLHIINGFSQNKVIDSLNSIISATKFDTTRGHSLCVLCDELANIGELDIALRKGEEGLKLLEKSQDPKGVSKCLNNIGIAHYYRGSYPEALTYFQRSLRVKKKIGDEDTVHIFTNIGLIYREQGDYTRALESFQRGLKTYEKRDDPEAVIACLDNIANVLADRGNHSEALNYYYKSLKISEKIGAYRDQASTLSNIGTIYIEQGNYSKALDYYQKSLRLHEKSGNKKGVANILNNIGNAYVSERNYPQALEYYRKSLEIRQQIGAQAGVSTCLNNIANVYFHQQNYQQALENYQESLKISELIQNQDGVIVSLTGMAEIYLKINQLALAKSYAEKGLRLAQQSENLLYMQQGAGVSYQAYSALGNWREALEAHKLYKQYSDSLINNEKSRELGRIESRYQFEKEAEAEKYRLETAKRTEAEATRRRDNLQYLTIFGIIITALGSFAFARRLNIPGKIIDIAIFTILLISFEFLLIFFDPYLDRFSEGIPFYKLAFNTIVAVGISPFHTYLQRLMRKKKG